ncbi:MAG: DUF2786 domain-containing protein [Polyangiales bacterium]
MSLADGVSTEKALDRVRKLLALATSSNVHEAAAAAAQAQTLITRHRLQQWLDAERDATVDADPIADASDAPLEVARKLRPWKVALASALAEVNGCVAYTLDRGADAAIVLVGRARDRAAVEALWAWAVKRIEWLSATHGEGKSRAWHEAFRVGASDVLARRLDEANRAEREASTETALVIVDRASEAHRAALERFVSERLSLRSGRGMRVVASAYEKGRRAAEGMALPK